MKKILSTIFILGLSILLPMTAHAGGGLPTPSAPATTDFTFSDFAVFGGNRVVLGRGIDASDDDPDDVTPEDPNDPIIVNGGNIGSNNNIHVYGRTDTESIVGGGRFVGGHRIDVNGDVIFNENVLIYGNSHITGDVQAGGDLTLGREITVGGDVTAGGSINLGPFDSIGGAVTANGTPTVFSPVSLPPETVFGHGTVDVRTGDYATTTLLPGSYDDLIMGDHNVLNLSAGKYYIDRLRMLSSSIINIDLSGGSFELYVTNGVSLGRYMDMNLINGSAEDVYIETNNWHSYSYATLYGTIFAHNSIVVGRKTHLTGALYAENGIHVYGGSRIDFDLACHLDSDQEQCQPPPTTSAVPEPASMALLGSGLLGAFGLRKKKAKA